MRYQLVSHNKTSFGPSSKATGDSAIIAERLGFRTIRFPCLPSQNRIKWFLGRIASALYIPICIVQIPRRCTLFIQHPDNYSGFVGMLLLKCIHHLRQAKIITLIHDVEPIHAIDPHQAKIGGQQLSYVCAISEKVIVHNSAMRKWFIDFGIQNEKLIELRIFDYLTDAPQRTNQLETKDSIRNSIAIAGFLGLQKAGYLSKLTDIKNIEWHLFGPGYDAQKVSGENIHYHGMIPAGELPSHLNFAFGLIWDGPNAEHCDDILGNYLRYNNPHKLSLFLASGLPVFIWDQAASAKFVRENNVGIPISSLTDIPVKLKNLSSDDYIAMHRAVQNIAPLLRQGIHLEIALNAALGV